MKKQKGRKFPRSPSTPTHQGLPNDVIWELEGFVGFTFVLDCQTL